MGKPKVLITGANGLIGSHLVQKAKNKYNLAYTSKSFREYHDDAFKQFDWLKLDDIYSFLSSIKPEYIVHTAGITSIEYAALNPIETEIVNVKAVSEIVRYCVENQVRLIHFSTDFVFDGKLKDYKELDPVNPISIYAKSKANSERIVLEGCNNSVVIRPSWVYGLSREMARMNFPLFIRKNLIESKNLSITSDQFRSPTYVGDIAETTLRLLATEEIGIFHIAGPECISVFDFALKIAETFSLDVGLLNPVSTPISDAAKARPLSTCLNITRAQHLLAYEPLNTDEGLLVLRQKLIDYNAP